MQSEKLLEVSDLKTHFGSDTGFVTAVDGISFHVGKGEILGVVGESGCGKSVTAESILRLHDEKFNTLYEGEINYKGENLLKLPMSKMEKIRGNEISMIFQDPMSSLNPVYTIGNQITEAILLHQDISKKEAYNKAIELLDLVGIPSPEKRIAEYPHELSGGMQQRVMIAIGLACQPSLLIADEPTTALDVTIQAQILDIMLRLNEELKMGVIFITHDLGVVAEICDRVAVMYLGQIVEEASTIDLFEQPLHPYTSGLMDSIPKMDGDRSKKLNVVKGSVPSLDSIPQGCRFASRCPFADELCLKEMPELRPFEGKKGSQVRCWHAEKILKERKKEHVSTD
jgi:oligopeptide/dipeptide ABC transporter ATP-binding protein